MTATGILEEIRNLGGSVKIAKGQLKIRSGKSLPRDLVELAHRHTPEIAVLLKDEAEHSGLIGWLCNTCNWHVRATGKPGRHERCGSKFWSRSAYSELESDGKTVIPIVPAEVDEPKPTLKRWICERCREGVAAPEKPHTCIRCGSHKFALESWWRKWIAS